MPRLSVWIIRTALLYLGVGFTFGALMLFNKGVPFDPMLWLLLRPHIEFVLLGWTMQLAMGVAFWIMPRLTGETGDAKYGNVRLAQIAYVLLNVGVLSAALGDWLGTAPWLATFGRAAEFLAALVFAVHIWPRVKPFGEQLKITKNE